MEIGHVAGRLTPKGRTSQPAKPGIDTAGGGFRAGAAGSKRYGSGQIAPTRGKIADKTGYMKRGVSAAAARQTAMSRLGGAQPVSQGQAGNPQLEAMRRRGAVVPGGTISSIQQIPKG